MKKQKKWLYEKWLEDHAEEIEKETFSKKTGIDKDRVVVNKVSFGGKIVEIAEDLFFKLIIAFIVIVLFALLSLAVTVLINAEIRNYVFNALGIAFH